MPLHPRLATLTERIRQKSAPTRQAYLARVAAAARREPLRCGLSCTNLAHGYAAAPEHDKLSLRAQRQPNLAIISAYNDMLSAHQPLAEYPAWIKQAAREMGATAQFAGGVPAMCDGITQGQEGMELSLFSRDVIAMSTAIALSHQMFDAVLCLGVCDKIVPGLLIGALHFGHLPVIFVPAGPMSSGLSNKEKAQIRQQFAEGKLDRAALLAAEEKSYHGAGTCTFYGTANSNQMLMEIMGLHLPGSAFVPPDTPLRTALVAEAARQAVRLAGSGQDRMAVPHPLAEQIDERVIVNGLVGLMATGGSTNHAIHLVAIARAAGIVIDWSDFDAVSGIVPLLTRVYPNGSADVNQFHAAGGMGLLIRELLDAGLLHEDVRTVIDAGRPSPRAHATEPNSGGTPNDGTADNDAPGSDTSRKGAPYGGGLRAYTQEPWLDAGRLAWRTAPAQSGAPAVLTTAAAPFHPDGGLRLLTGNLGRAIIKVSAVAAENHRIEAPARIFHTQQDFMLAFQRGELVSDCVMVLRFQGPRANGMPELHQLTPALGVLQDKGLRVALLTDGRMSGASGKVPAAIHLSPEALAGGAIARLRDGDRILLDAAQGRLEALVPDAEWRARLPCPTPEIPSHGSGRELFVPLRQTARSAEEGAGSFA